ncbi:hypothetical protein [Heyndrickxia shackletonii]|nr:hypothetical protein [Heyndrickxia shackletonii]
MKNKISDLIDTISEMIDVLLQINDPLTEISDCLAALEAISSQIIQEENIPRKTITQLQKIEIMFETFLNNSTQIDENTIKDLKKQVILFKSIFVDEIKAKLNIVFFPYKASMWDSLASVYEAAAEDRDCVVHVVPIPYFQLSQNEAIPTYEGSQFPENVPITHYSQYKLEEQEPDIIFIHNIYDNFNTLTCVFEEYFTSNLKKFTDMLVYVPYYVSSFIPYKKGEGFYPYDLPSIKNIDKIILVNNTERDIAIKEGIPSDKLLVLGSPKLDAMVKALKSEISYPVGWKEKLEGKTVYLVNTGCLYFANQPFLAMERLIDLFNIPRFIDNSIIIWRPHPLTKTSIMKYTPHFLGYFKDLTEKHIKGEGKLYKGIILDETDDYIPALRAADILISTDFSLLRSYLLTEKIVMYWDDMMPKGSLLPSNVFYYALNKSEPWYELVKKFSKGYDPLLPNRKGMAEKVYVNTDGTSGEKVYLSIKEIVLCASNNYVS